jgi:hypothetical protein
MTDNGQDVRRWITAFERRARALLVAHGTARRQGYQVRAQPCPRHADGCVWVQYGVLAEHVAWAEEEPGRLAERLVATLPPRGT